VEYNYDIHLGAEGEMLPARDMRILSLLCAGKCSKQIAVELRLSVSSVEKARSRLMSVFAKDKLRAVLYLHTYLASQIMPTEQHPFTKRQREVIRHIVSGLHNDQIASRMQISLSTVEKHVTAIMASARFENRFQIIVWGVMHNVHTEQSR
jgi:DNA-binding NarL/FixJ family response regulator